jgi:hypothetical protein
MLRSTYEHYLKRYDADDQAALALLSEGERPRDALAGCGPTRGDDGRGEPAAESG